MAEEKLSEDEMVVLSDLKNIEPEGDEKIADNYGEWVKFAEEEMKVNVKKIANIALAKFASTENFDIVKILIEKGADVNIKVKLKYEEMSLLEWFITILQYETLDIKGGLELVCKTEFDDDKIQKLLEIINLILDKNVELSPMARDVKWKHIFDKCTSKRDLFNELNRRINPDTNPDKKEGGKRKSRKQRKSRKSRNQKKQLRSRRFKRQTR